MFSHLLQVPLCISRHRNNEKQYSWVCYTDHHKYRIYRRTDITPRILCARWSCAYSIGWLKRTLGKPTNPLKRQSKGVFDTFGLTQNAAEATHSKGHILDYKDASNPDDLRISNISISDVISDHHIISCNFSFNNKHSVLYTVTYHKIKDIDIDSFNNRSG